MAATQKVHGSAVGTSQLAVRCEASGRFRALAMQDTWACSEPIGDVGSQKPFRLPRSMRQYSSGRSRVVTERSHSVMIQIRVAATPAIKV